MLVGLLIKSMKLVTLFNKLSVASHFIFPQQCLVMFANSSSARDRLAYMCVCVFSFFQRKRSVTCGVN